MNSDTSKPDRKAQIDALLLKLPGVSARKINGLDAYFVSDKMFACISGDGVALRLPAASVTELRFSMANTVAFYLHERVWERVRGRGAMMVAPQQAG